MKKILWVEDDLTYGLSAFVEALEDEGFSIIKSRDATEGRKTFESIKDNLDAVILDIMMPPGGDFGTDETRGGFRSVIILARHIRKQRPDIPIIGFSAVSDPEVVHGDGDVLKLFKFWTEGA